MLSRMVDYSIWLINNGYTRSDCVERISSLCGLGSFSQIEWYTLLRMMQLGRIFHIVDWLTRLPGACSRRYPLSRQPPPQHTLKQTCKVMSHDWAGPVGVVALLNRDYRGKHLSLPQPLSSYHFTTHKS